MVRVGTLGDDADVLCTAMLQTPLQQHLLGRPVAILSYLQYGGILRRMIAESGYKMATAVNRACTGAFSEQSSHATSTAACKQGGGMGAMHLGVVQ